MHAYGEEGVRFYTKQKSIMQRWPERTPKEAEFVMPTEVGVVGCHCAAPGQEFERFGQAVMNGARDTQRSIRRQEVNGIRGGTDRVHAD